MYEVIDQLSKPSFFRGRILWTVYQIRANVKYQEVCVFSYGNLICGGHPPHPHISPQKQARWSGTVFVREKQRQKRKKPPRRLSIIIVAIIRGRTSPPPHTLISFSYSWSGVSGFLWSEAQVELEPPPSFFGSTSHTVIGLIVGLSKSTEFSIFCKFSSSKYFLRVRISESWWIALCPKISLV